MTNFKTKKAQQLVEFLLVAPILIIFLGILTEYAYALNINMTLTQGLKTVTSGIYAEIKPSMSASEINATVKSDLVEYLHNNNVPTEAENNIKVNYTTTNDLTPSSTTKNNTAVFFARYTYYSAFTLPNVWFHFLPDQFEFYATNVVPAAFISGNNYDSTDSRKLDKIWSQTSSFSTEDDFNASKRGIMKTTTGRSAVAFLVKTEASSLTTPYALVGWDGNIKTDSSGNSFVIDMTNGKFYTCSSTSCNLYSQTLFNYLISKKYYNLFVVPTDFMEDTSYLSENWIRSSETNISDTTITGILKNVLSISSEDLSLGNYDNINVSDFNADLSTTNKVTMKNYGSFIVIYPSEITVSKLGASIVTNKDYNFNE